MLSVNSAIVALYGYLQTDKPAVSSEQKTVWLWSIPVAGMIVCSAWVVLLTSYRKLFKRERELTTRERRRSLSWIETAIPFCFILLYAAVLVAVIVTWPGK